VKVTPYELGFPLAMNDPNRGKGLHASDIYGDFKKKLNPKRYKTPMDPKTQDLLFAIGLAWEQYLEKVLVANGVLCGRPGELTSDEDVKYSPDLLIVNGEDRLGEIKATYKSARTCYPGNKQFDDDYLFQTKLYCHWTSIPRVRYYVLFIHGDWRQVLIDHKAWDIEFTKRELLDNHKMMMNHARDERMFETPRPVAGAKRAGRNKR
jgi:hypothetical protein